jgi:hypothetical protein
MGSYSKRYIVGLALLVLLALLYFLVSYLLKEKPYEVLTPDVYEKGTTVSLYNNVPSSFPKEFIQTNTKLDYSGELTTPSGKTQTTASFVSNESILYIINSYRSSLAKEGWSVGVESLTERAGILRSTKGEETVMLSVVPINPNETLITVQYENN